MLKSISAPVKPLFSINGGVQVGRIHLQEDESPLIYAADAPSINTTRRMIAQKK
jgi:hypothetical protein